VQRVLVLGRGGAGKSTFARQLSEILGIPAVELDQHFWSAAPQPLAASDWAERQALLVAPERWILDGDLGPYDVLDVRLRRADTVVVLDFSFTRCAWRAVRRSREAADFWRWVWHYRRRSAPRIRAALRVHAPGATVHWLTTPRQARRLLRQVRSGR
jgi:adenylate kinase family enzyme